MSRVLVTGASGFVGAAVVRALLARGHRVAALSRGPGPRLAGLGEGALLVRGSLEDLEALRPGLESFGPEAVVHAAWDGVFGASRQDPAQARNIAPALALMDLTARLGARQWIAFGSQAEYGPRCDAPGEDSPCRPDTLYGAAKLATCSLLERLSAERNLAFCWLRLYSAYGPGSEGWLLDSVIAQLLAGRTPRLNSSGLQLWDYLHVDDAAGAVASVLEQGSRGIYNLGSGQAQALRAILERLRDLIDPAAHLEFGPAPGDQAALPCLHANIRKLRAATGWSPRIPLQEGLAACVEAAKEGRARKAGLD